jgi:peptidoglycan/LPS O-acetylase OafA/YrhL
MADSRSHLAFLDGLRGIASLWVLVGHAMFMTGYKLDVIAQPDMAVELFIIISGFLMTWHYQERAAREPWDAPSTWKIFWVRRFFRIAPLYYVCLAVALMLGPLLWQFRLESAALLSEPLAEQQRYIERYLDQSFQNIVLHVSFLFGMTYTNNFQTPLPDWSIGLEMQYYAVFPFIMLLLMRIGKIAGMMLLVALAWPLGYWLEHHGYVVGAYSILAMKFHLFAAGMLIALGARTEGRLKWLYIALAIAVIFVPLGGARTALHRSIKIGIVLGFFILLHRDRLNGWTGKAAFWLDSIFSNPASRWIGDLSYGVYLIHLIVMLPVCGLLATTFPGSSDFTRFLMALALTIPITYSLAWLAYRFIEQPGIGWGRALASRFRPAERRTA